MPNTKAQFTSSQKPRPLLVQEIVNDWSVHNYNVLCFPMKFRSTNGYNGASIAQGSDATYARKKSTNARKGLSKASSFERHFVMFSVTVIIALMIINSLVPKPYSSWPSATHEQYDMRSSLEPSPYAYLWIIGGVNEDNFYYKGFVWDVLVSASMLRKLGSTADFWLYIRMSPDSKLDKLPAEDLRLLDALGVNVKHLDKPVYESFGLLMFDKFLILNMTQYKRVMFLDSDTLPLTNMDYIFHLSDPDYKLLPTVMNPYLVLSSRREPTNGAMFVVEPSAWLYEQYLETVRLQREKALTMPYPHFSKGQGWGYDFTANNDHWESVWENGTAWNWHGSHVDQGLLYYLGKFVANKSSFAIGERLQNWKRVPGQKKPELESETTGVLDKYQGKVISYQFQCDKPIEKRKGVNPKFDSWCHSPNNAFAHFNGDRKPWSSFFKLKWLREPSNKTSTSNRFDSRMKWWRELTELNAKYQMGINFTFYNDDYIPLMQKPSLGATPKYADQSRIIGIQTKGKDKWLREGGTVAAMEKNPDKSVVAYAISLIKCGDHQNVNAAGLIDAALVLRHSVHKISKRNPASGSKYDYKMYAIVHRQAKECSGLLEHAGYKVIEVDPPILQKDIEGDYLRENIHRERCCGAAEFIKLYAYSLPESVIVHVDMDNALYKPMDHLFDAILYEKDSVEGQAARKLLELERPGEELPDKIGAFITRDWTQVRPGKFPPGYQAGFLVARRDPSVMPAMLDIVREGNYSEGWGWKYGWGNKGYGGWVGAMAMQGLVAYYYDHINTDNAVELNQCLYNHVGVDVKMKGKCRNGMDACEDCQKTSMSSVYTIHHTNCRKPWLCQATGSATGKKAGGGRGSALNTNNVKVDHCLEMAQEWHSLRSDLEESLYKLTKDEGIPVGRTGGYRKDVFQGHCKDDGSDHYLRIGGSDESKRRINELYE